MTKNLPGDLAGGCECCYGERKRKREFLTLPARALGDEGRQTPILGKTQTLNSAGNQPERLLGLIDALLLLKQGRCFSYENPLALVQNGIQGSPRA